MDQLQQHCDEVNKKWHELFAEHRLHWVTTMPYALMEWCENFHIDRLLIADSDEEYLFAFQAGNNTWYVRNRVGYYMKREGGWVSLADYLGLEQDDVVPFYVAMGEAGLGHTGWLIRDIIEKHMQTRFLETYQGKFPGTIAFKRKGRPLVIVDEVPIDLTYLYIDFCKKERKKPNGLDI